MESPRAIRVTISAAELDRLSSAMVQFRFTRKPPSAPTAMRAEWSPAFLLFLDKRLQPRQALLKLLDLLLLCLDRVLLGRN